MSDETKPGLREKLVKALTAEHYRRSRQGILASPEIHSAAMADAAMAVVRPELEQLLAQLPPDGQGRWRQGTKNRRNLYVHQADDEVGQPVGQMYSAELAALVCDAVNAQQARGGA